MAGLGSSLLCWRCLILTSGPRDPGNRVGRCCVYGVVTAGFRKMKLPVQTAAPLTAPVKSHGMLHCLDVNHLLQPQEGEGDRVTFVSLSRPRRTQGLGGGRCVILFSDPSHSYSEGVKTHRNKRRCLWSTRSFSKAFHYCRC